MWIREQEDWDAVDVPEMTDEDFARALPFEQAFPDLAFVEEARRAAEA